MHMLVFYTKTQKQKILQKQWIFITIFVIIVNACCNFIVSIHYEYILWPRSADIIGGTKMKSDITIKMARCKGCGICVAFCPKQVLALDELGKVQVKNGEACIACGQCELRCPDYAIFVDKKVAE